MKSSSFIWGTATSSYQIEGAVTQDGRGPSIWDTFCKQPEVIQDGTNGDIACDHYNRFKQDVQLIKDLGVEAYRFSIAWPRIFPQGTGKLNAQGMDFYNRLTDELLEKGLQPWVTLYHWDLPQALQDRGGWTNRDIVGWFCDYAEAVTRALSDRVSHFILLNEPSVTTFHAHVEGVHAPRISDKKAALAVTHHQNLAIGQGFSTLKSVSDKLIVGSSYTLFPIRPAHDTPESRHARDVMDCLWNRNFFDALNKGEYPELFRKELNEFCHPDDMKIIQAPLDFIGLQHYTPAYAYAVDTTPVGANFGPSPSHFALTDMGWAVDPSAFTECLVDFKTRYGDKNLIITENGAAFPDQMINGTINDEDRISYFQTYLAALEKAMDQGVRVTGYFIWSFLDNFEWAYGLSKRFGVVYVDYKDNLKRVPKNSYYWWQSRLEKLLGNENERKTRTGT